MIQFDDIIEIFDAADFDVGFKLRIVVFDGRRIGAALVDRNLLRRAMLTQGNRLKIIAAAGGWLGRDSRRSMRLSSF
jgi:hypothetical protein